MLCKVGGLGEIAEELLKNNILNLFIIDKHKKCGIIEAFFT